MIKIAYLITYIVNNGPSRVVINLINGLDRSSFTPLLITLVSDKNDAGIIEQIRRQTKVIEMDMADNKDCLLRGRSVFEGALEQEGVSIVHSHGLIPDMVAVLYGKRFLRVSTLHNNLWEDYAAEYGRIGRYFWAPLHVRVLKKMDRCVCCSSSVFDAVRASLPKCSYVRNGISTQQEDPNTDEHEKELIERTVSQIPDKAFVFLFAGRMIDRKKPEWLVREFTASHAEDEYLIMAGDGPLLETCRAQSDEHVIFPGFVKNIRSLYKIADVYVSASSSEGLSISVIEAMEQGNALLLSDIPSHRELVGISDDCYPGELFREQDFKKHLEKLRENRALLDRSKIRDIQIRYLSGAAMARGYEAVYDQLSPSGKAGI